VVFEFWGHYEYLKDKGWWTRYPVEDYMVKQRASYISLYWEANARTFIEKEPAYIQRLGNRMGYWFILTQAAYPAAVAPGAALDVTLQWTNRGVAACLRNYPIALVLTDEQGKTLALSISAQSDTRRWLPETPVTERVSVVVPATLPPGAYEVRIGLVESPLTDQCAIRLGITGRDAQGRYRLGRVTVKD
jgi:hypothetical protein